MRYNRASIDSALRAAVATGARYVYATYGGYVATDLAPPAIQAHYEIVNGHPVLRRSRLRVHLTAGDIIYRLREKRAAIVRRWAEAARYDRKARADLAPWAPLDRMWRLTAAIDAAIVRLGGEV